VFGAFFDGGAKMAAHNVDTFLVRFSDGQFTWTQNGCKYRSNRPEMPNSPNVTALLSGV